jgi:hypothetical protein
MDINRLLVETSETVNTLGGAASSVSLAKYDICGDDTGEPDCNVSSSLDKEPHSGTASSLGMSQLGMRWNALTDSYQNVIPAVNQNFTIFQNLQVRAAVDFSECTSGQDYNFTIQLIDAGGATSSVVTQNYTHALYYPPGSQVFELPKVCFNSIKIPLTDFSGIDLTQVQRVKFLYDQVSTGSIYITDLTLSGLTPIATSVSHNFPASVAAIFPNPAGSSINIKLGSEFKSITSLKLFDVQGKLIYQTSEISELMSIDLERFDKGVYILNIASTRDSRNYKIIKQ